MAQRPNLVKGNLQLYSVDQQRSQALDAHAAAFATLKVTRSFLGVESNPTLKTLKTYTSLCQMLKSSTPRRLPPLKTRLACGAGVALSCRGRRCRAR